MNKPWNRSSLNTPKGKKAIFSHFWGDQWQAIDTMLQNTFEMNPRTKGACWKDLWTIKVKNQIRTMNLWRTSLMETRCCSACHSTYSLAGRKPAGSAFFRVKERCKRCHSLLTFMGRQWNVVKQKPNSGWTVTAVKRSKLKQNWWNR